MLLIAAACTTEPTAPAMQVRVAGGKLVLMNRSNFQLRYYVADPDFLARVDLVCAPEVCSARTIGPFNAVEVAGNEVLGFSLTSQRVMVQQWREVQDSSDAIRFVDRRTIVRNVEAGDVRFTPGLDTRPPPPG